MVWDSRESTVLDVSKGIIKCKLLTGRYLLQSNRHKFSQSVVSAKYRCCGIEDEDIAHMLLYCPSYSDIFKDQIHGYCRFGNFRVTFISRIFDFRIIREFLNSRASIQLIKIAI